MHGSCRFRKAIKFFVLPCFIVLSCCWLLLYLESIYQRRRAERFVDDLKSFPFATAGFVEVRDLMNRHGGTALQQFPVLHFSQYGLPSLDSQGQAHVLIFQTEPTCTQRDCTFEIRIKNRTCIPVRDWTTNVLYSVSVYSGIRPWSVWARFEVSGGKLERSQIGIGQLRNGKLGSYKGLIPLGYNLTTTTRPQHGNNSYVVGSPHVTGPPMDLWDAWSVLTLNPPTRRALDVNLHCLTTVFHGCRNLSELAPSAWADYEQQLKQRPSPDD